MRISLTSLTTIIFVTRCLISVNTLTSSGTATSSFNQIITNLNAIVNHIQNPQLYSSSWADKIAFQDKNHDIIIPIAKSDIDQGEIIALYPIQAITIGKDVNHEMKSLFVSEESILSKRVELLQDERYPYPHLRSLSEPIYIHADKNMIYDGWYGNTIPIHNEKTTSIRSNCIFVPLPSVAPFCGMVATRSISKGEAITCTFEMPICEELYQLTNDIAKKYANELGELLPYLQMAYAGIQTNTKEKSETIEKKKTYHALNQNYPNLEKIHSNPDIYTIQDFLSVDECERVIQKAQLNMQPCLVKNEDTGAVEIDPSRTSTNANLPRREVPSIKNKILNLVNCLEEQLETFQVLNYKNGQEFKVHTDGFDGPTTACGFQDSGRIVTIFCYLNDVPSGGTTLFPKLGLDIVPKRGMAVVHFPMSLDLVEDALTEHQGSAALDEKWVLTTWIWKHWMADYRYSEKNIDSLSDDII